MDVPRRWGGAAAGCTWGTALPCPLSLNPSKCPPTLPPSPQLGAGHTWEIDTSYKWKGLDGKWEGYGPDMQPQVRGGGGGRARACTPAAHSCAAGRHVHFQ